MKIKVTLKDPDGVYESVRQSVKDSMVDLPLSGREHEAVLETRTEGAEEALRRWVDCGEYVTIEFDTEAGTATVLER